MITKIDNELRELFIKIIVPALVIISVKLSIQNKRDRVSLFNVVSSIISGIGVAYLSSGLILKNFSDEWIALIVAAVTLTSEKIVAWFIYKMDIDLLGDAFIEMLKNWIIKRSK